MVIAQVTKEVRIFELSAIMRPPIRVNEDSFSQFSFDNADFNSQTLDGYRTLHAMGGIHCVTPTSAIIPDQCIERLKSRPSAAEIGKFGTIPLMQFEKKSDDGFKNVKIKDLNDIKPISSKINPQISDLS